MLGALQSREEGGLVGPERLWHPFGACCAPRPAVCGAQPTPARPTILGRVVVWQGDVHPRARHDHLLGVGLQGQVMDGQCGQEIEGRKPGQGVQPVAKPRISE